MEKEFEIEDILNAVGSISRIERKKGVSTKIKKKNVKKNDVLTLNNEAKFNKNDILVLDQMIE